jgi:hypothetical protein
LLLITVIFNWRTLLTRQFTLLSEAEGVNQGYSWLVFCIHRIRHFQLPGWDPFTFAGRSFVGEMQTSAFSPFNLLLAAVPLNRYDLVYPYAYNIYIGLLHFLAACFMYLLARELKQSRYASLLSAVCFSCGGYLARVGWPDMIQSCIWLPLTFVFLLRAFRFASLDRRGASTSRRTPRSRMWRNAAYCGLTIGLAILGGRLHIVLMQVIVVVTAVAYYAWRDVGEPAQLRSTLLRRALPIATTAVLFGFAVGAVQLLPSIEYAPFVIRAIGPTAIAAKSAIPYKYLGGNVLSPHGLLTVLFPFGFNGDNGIGERLSPYMGVFPLLLVFIGIAFNWRNQWVRYLSVLSLLSLLYAMGPFFGLHGFLYALVPWFWLLREATRLLYLTSFSMAILAGFGADSLLARTSNWAAWRAATRVFTAVVSVFAIALAVPLLFGKPELNNWVSLSLVLIFLSYGLYRYILAGHTGKGIQFVIIAFILVDLSPFDWTARNKTDLAQTNSDYLKTLVSCDGAVRFLKSQPGLFRVQVEGAQAPNIGDAFGVYTTGGMAATFVYTTGRLKDRLDLLNVEYLVKPASAIDPAPVYADAYWKVYRNATAFPHAWLVHQIVFQPDREATLSQIESFRAGDLRARGFVNKPLNDPLDPPSNQPESATVTSYGIDFMSISVKSSGRALLVLSENNYPGWHATVNGRPATIHEVDGGLRGIVVPNGDSTVVLRYAPGSIRIGAILSAFAFLSLAVTFVFDRRRT